MMQSFNYRSPRTLEEAFDFLNQHGEDVKLIAGGTDLLVEIKAGLSNPKNVMNIKNLPELRGIHSKGENGLRLGALTTVYELSNSALLMDLYPGLVQAASQMASIQIRSLATIGGNLCTASPAADLASPLIALDAEVVILSPSGERELPLESFFLGPGTTVLKSNEILKEIILPAPAGNLDVRKHSLRESKDIAIVGVATRLLLEGNTCLEARIALAAVGPTPLRAKSAEKQIEGFEISAERIDKAAQTAAEESTPIDDLRGSAWYRKHMVAVLVRRSLQVLTLPGERA